jgi:formamidase
MAAREVRIDRSKSLPEKRAQGHNRWHPNIPPLVRCEPGDEVVLETRDAFDGQMRREATLEAVAVPNLDVVHPLTGPVYVEGAEPGDLLEVEIIEVIPDNYGYTVQVPGFGFLRDVFPEPFMVRWDIAEGWAPEIASEALRTIPPREQAGNVDIKQLGAGTHLFIPVDTPSGLFSVGDAHFAQGDCETCGTAIEMNATLRARFMVHKGEAKEKGIRDPRFSRLDYWVAPEYAVPRRFYATTGMSVSRDREVRPEDATLAARNALLNTIDHLGERGWSGQQGYAICSVAVDLKVSQLVDVPTFLVSVFLPEDLFSG